MQFQINDIVKKGNGATLYRIVAIAPMHGRIMISVVKSTTKNVPRLKPWFKPELFTKV